MKSYFYILTFLSFFSGSTQSIRDLYQEGLKAHEKKEYQIFLEKMQQIDSMRPNYPAVVYNLAGGYALTGESAKAIETLEKYVLMDATQDFSKDADFASVISLPAFSKMQEKQRNLTTTINPNSQKSYPLLASHPEAITYDDKKSTYFIGGARDGIIWKVKDEKIEQWAESSKKSWSVMGLEVSPDGNYLWACTSSMNNYQDYNQDEEGYASVLKYDLNSGELLKTFALTGGHNFGDLIADKTGNIFISDGTANKLYWINKQTEELDEFMDLSEKVFNLQGLTISENGENLFLSDYIDGIYKLNIQSKTLIKLEIKDPNILIKGIDGLYFTENSLIGLHNGTKPNRVVKYALSDNQIAIVSKLTLSQGGDLGEPTQGVWVEGALHFIMNSPWGAYDRDGNFEPNKGPIIIGILD